MKKFFSIVLLILLVMIISCWVCPRYQYCPIIGDESGVVRGNTVTGEIDIYSFKYSLVAEPKQLQKTYSSQYELTTIEYLIVTIIKVLVIATLSYMLIVTLKGKKKEDIEP